MNVKTIKRIVLWGLLAALVIALIALPAAARRKNAAAESTVMSAPTERKELQMTLAGGGVLQAREAEELTVPDGVEIRRFLVSNGEYVEEGQALAEIDTVTALSAIAKVQESLDSLNDQLRELADSGSVTVTGKAEGRVKAIYVQPGDDVRRAVLEHGALAVISLDGLMSVTFSCEAPLQRGDAVTVRCPDGTEYPGRVESAVGGSVTVTLTDDGPQIDDAAQILGADGALLGSGALAVHQPWKPLVSDGTVSSVDVREGQKISARSTLMRIRDAGETERTRLSQKRRDYEDLLRELLILYRSTQLCAPCAGFVSGVDSSVATDMAASGSGTLRLLAGEKEESPFSYYLVMVTGTGAEGVCLGKGMLWPFPINDESELALLFGLSKGLLEDLEAAPVFVGGAVTLEGEPVEEVRPGDVFVLISRDGELAKTVYLGHNEPEEEPQPSPEIPDVPEIDLSGYAAVTPEEDDGLFPLEGTTVLSVTPADTMRVVVSVDELDVLQYEKGMDAEITVDALPGESFSGTVTEIAGVGSNSGGSSKFDVTVELTRSGEMLPGMNCSVTIHKGGTGQVLTIPSAALNDEGSKCFVYTAYDPKTKMLIAPVPVEIGYSDGESVEIVSGLTEGQSVWYDYYVGTEKLPQPGKS